MTSCFAVIFTSTRIEGDNGYASGGLTDLIADKPAPTSTA